MTIPLIPCLYIADFAIDKINSIEGYGIFGLYKIKMFVYKSRPSFNSDLVILFAQPSSKGFCKYICTNLLICIAVECSGENKANDQP
jgi:hypothetical protein